MAARPDRHAPDAARVPTLGLTLDSLACGLIVVSLAAVPALFNPRGENAFGVVKGGLLQVLGLVAGVCAAVHTWSAGRPLRLGVLPAAAALVVAAFGIATICGIAPALSFFADGPRHEGMYIVLALAATGFAISTLDGERLDAVVTALVVGSIGPSVYAIVQMLVADGDTVSVAVLRAGSTLGNPVLLGGYLVTVIPITAAVAIGRSHSWRRTAEGIGPDPPQSAGGRGRSLASAFGYWLVLVLQLTAISLAWARGAWLSLLVAAVVVGAATIGLTGRRRRLVAALAAGAVMATAILGGALVRARYGTFIPGETVQVRVLIWQQVTELLRARPERMPLGYGPEMLHAVVAPFYSPRLTAIEGQFSVPDRAHNDLLDAAVNAGLLGVAAVIALHLLFWAQLLPRVQTSRAGSTRWRDAAAALAGGASAGAIALVSQHAEWLAVATAAGIVAGLMASLTWGSLRSAGAGWSPARCLAAGVLASGLAHFTEIQFGIATISSRLVWWSCLGIATAWARGAHLSRVEAEPQPPAAAVPLAAAVMIAALAFAFWQPRAGLSVPAMFVLASTGAVAALLEWNNGQPAARRRMAAAWAAAAVVVAAMIAGLATWDAAVPAGGVVDAANWASHQATASLVFFLVAGSAVALAFRPDRPALFGWRPVVGFLAVGAVAIVVVDSSARRARADLLAQIAGSLSGAGRRVEAGIVGAQRVRLTPESDRAWSALGSIELEMARRPEAPDRGVHFARASGALGEARRRNPFDWFHVRNQASAERVWAAADREGRAEHLAAADRLFGEAAILAPAFPRLWAEWGNVAAEKGDLRDAFVKLERAATLGGVRDAKTVADAILGATGFDIRDRAGRIRAAADLRRQGFTSLAALYADY